MDVYRQAADIVDIVRNGRGTAKALCLRKEMQKKKQTYAVVCETLRYYDLIADVLEQAQFFEYYPRASKPLAMVLAYDTVIGRGVHTHNDSTAVAIQNSSAYLRDAYLRVQQHHVIKPRSAEVWDDGKGGTSGGDYAATFPRYARVNLLKIATDEFITRITRPKRAREDGEEVASKKEQQRFAAGKKRVVVGGTILDFERDPHIPDLLVFPPQTDLHAHPSVRSGQLVLQDKASCIPACVLLDAVPVVLDEEIEASQSKLKPIEYIVDACSAPGNKTTQLAAIGAKNGIKLLAVERDSKRAALLQQRVTSLGGGDLINVVNEDFCSLTNDIRDATEAILLDPSCSASGVVTRVDVAVHSTRKRDPNAVEDDEAGEGEFGGNDRVEKLARVQKKLLTHALLSFNACRRVVYSTCSIHELEDECVVRDVLLDERIRARGWQLSNIMPDTWTTRGHRVPTAVQSAKPEKNVDPSSEAPAAVIVVASPPSAAVVKALHLEYTIRCDPSKDKTNGFFVARFDRKVSPAEKQSADDDGAANDPEGGEEASSSNGDEAIPEGGATKAEVEVDPVVAAAEASKKIELTAAMQALPKKLAFDSDSDSD